MSLDAARAAFGAAIHEEDIAGPASTAGKGHESCGCRGSDAARADPHDRPERPAGAAAADTADPGAEHLPDGADGRGASTAISSLERPSTAFVLRVHAESTESHSVPGLQEESVLGDILGGDVSGFSEPHNGDSVVWIFSGYDASDSHPGVDGSAGRPAAYHNAVGEEHAGSEASTADGHRSGGSSAGGSGSTSAAVLRELDTTEAVPIEARVPSRAEAVAPGVHAAGDDPRPYHGAPQLRHHDAGAGRSKRDAPYSSAALRQPGRDDHDRQLSPFSIT